MGSDSAGRGRALIALNRGVEPVKPLAAFAEGLEKLGFECHVSTANSYLADYQLLVSYGQRNDTWPLRYRAMALKIPTIVMDLGYLKRASSRYDDGYFQAGWGEIGWRSNLTCPSDRLDALGIEVLETRVSPTHPVWVLAGQMPGDGQHGLGRESLHSVLKKMAQLAGMQGKKVVYRPHPNDSDKRFDGAPLAPEGLLKVPMSELVDLVEGLIAFNSTSGVEAVVRGVPVFCDKSAHYSSVASASYEERKKFLCQLAYSQWNLEELASGEAAEFLLVHRPF